MNGSNPLRSDAVFVSVQDAAELLHLSRTAIFELVRTREIASVRHGKRRLIGRRSLDAWAASRLADAGFDSVD